MGPSEAITVIADTDPQLPDWRRATPGPDGHPGDDDVVPAQATEAEKVAVEADKTVVEKTIAQEEPQGQEYAWTLIDNFFDRR